MPADENEDRDFILKLFAVICFLIVGYEFFWGTGQFVSGSQTCSWSRTEGKIVASKMVQSLPLAYGFSGPTSVRPNYPKINYEYKVRDLQFQGDRIQFGLVFNSPEMRRYFQAEKAVPVFYNPGQPRQAVLKTGVSRIGILYTLAIILFFLCLGLVVWFYRG
jgi:hypothetical protein